MLSSNMAFGRERSNHTQQQYTIRNVPRRWKKLALKNYLDGKNVEHNLIFLQKGKSEWFREKMEHNSHKFTHTFAPETYLRIRHRIEIGTTISSAIVIRSRLHRDGYGELGTASTMTLYAVKHLIVI